MRKGTDSGLPELMRFTDGRPVEKAEQWAERRKEILALFETCMYGKMPDVTRESVSYAIATGAEAQTREMKITVSPGRKGNVFYSPGDAAGETGCRNALLY